MEFNSLFFTSNEVVLPEHQTVPKFKHFDCVSNLEYTFLLIEDKLYHLTEVSTNSVFGENYVSKGFALNRA